MIITLFLLLIRFLLDLGISFPRCNKAISSFVLFLKNIQAKIYVFHQDKPDESRKDRVFRYIRIGIITVFFHWLLLYIGYLLMGQDVDFSVGAFGSFVYDRFKNAGDIPHYVDIAQNWYHAEGDAANNIVFFPLFPILMKVVYFVFRDYVLSGVVISNICLGIANIFLYKLIQEEYDRKKAVYTLVFFNIFPPGFFLIGAYTESLFICLSVICLYYIRKQQWLIVGVCGMLAAFSRSQGVILVVPAVYEIILNIKKRFSVKLNLSPAYLAVLLIPVGTVLYLLINCIVYGQWNKFIEYQAAEPWYNTAHWIGDNLAQHYNMALDYPYLSAFIYWPQILLYFFVLLLIIYAYFKKSVRPSTLCYGTAYIFVTYLHGWMISGPRYILSCIPLYIILATSDSKALKIIWFIISTVFAVLFSMWYMQGQAIM